MERETDDHTDEREAAFDRFAREASASLRRPAPAAGGDAIVRAAQRQRARQRLIGAAGAVIVLITGAVVVGRAARRGDGRGTTPATTVSPGASSTLAATTSLAPTTSAAPLATTTIPVRAVVPRAPLSEVPPAQAPTVAGLDEFEIPPNPKHLATDGTTLWILHGNGPISRRDARTGADLGAITTVPLGTYVERPQVAFGSLWVTTPEDDTLRRIDATSGEVTASIRMPGDISVHITSCCDHHESASVTASETAVWVLLRGDAPAFVEIDPATNTIVRQVPAPAKAWNIRYGLGSLWTVNMVDLGRSEPLVRIDPVDGRELATIQAVGPMEIAFGFGSLWTAEIVDGNEAWARYDPATNEPIAEILYPNGFYQTDLAFAGGYVWANEAAAGLAKIDPSTNRIVARYLEGGGGGGTAATDTVVWFANWSTSRLYRVPIA